ncbi:germinal-center associated nuclear protein [Rhineura floridana]|uniref:germinal-center associated nuclear protein n=1 Tax=Rhineura floridana TaxID=261503 RepID=UPI002AC82A42|nr:germinal-center associated nuclear protein [Rhineura floridana]XP_061463614.1 germinal-center associated nuclear protein [Rhineura floridana]
MNPNTPFSGQQPGAFQVPSGTSAGIFPVQPPFPFSQLSLFGQNNGALLNNPGFTHLSDFTITSGLRGSSGQGIGFGQPPEFTQPCSLGHTTSFVTSAPTSSSIANKQGFSFKPPTNLGTSQSTSSFGATSGEASGSGFVRPDFSFKSPEDAVFKPIFGSEQEKMGNQITPTPFTFSFPGGSGLERVAPFGIPRESSTSGASSSFSFTKPVSSNTLASSFTGTLPNKITEDDKKRPVVLFASPSSSFTSFSNSSIGSLGDTFQSNKTSKPEHEELLPLSEPLPILAKGIKRKEEEEHSSRRHDYDAVEEPELLARSEHSSTKRPVRLNRPRVGGLFDRVFQEVMKSNKKESKMERVSLESGEMEQTNVAGGTHSGFATGRPGGTMKKEENKAKLKEDSTILSPLRRSRNSGSTESLGGLSSSELTAIQYKNIPDHLNKRNVLENHFKKFIKFQRIRTNPNKKLAVIQCFDHASAALAKKKAKELHKEIVALWHKKKPSPNKKDYSSKEHKADENEGRQSNDQLSHQHSSHSKSLIRSTGSGNLSTKSSPAKKAGLKKSLQFEAYPFDSGSEGHGSESLEASVSSFSNLVGTVAETSEDKYRLLDQRDKIMRQARVKQIDLGKAKTFVGTCPDMCPEKERYMRETRNQLSVFEVIPGTDKVDHAAAIKEYSRSSADQEEPLPHELRPSEVLSMTMDYLVTQIMDKGEGNYREWYDFVWNRTRGIRKDITQQHLCCPLTVSLIEKCTRFHIHCSHHLCEEPMSSFDAKINNENMTKCLQSLKEMYQDLTNKGIYCKSEAEFRGYNVLLNLNKGDILREVQQYRPAVRNSTEVRFAVQAFAALNSNNFVRFFKLVQTASYLNACLLHCYFSQIRRDALKSLNIAYTVNAQRSTIFPLHNVVRMLLFKNFEDATDFISYYGLSVSDGFVELNRSAFLEPESLPKPKKSLFVGQKLTVSIGEIVNGGSLPPVIRHVPLYSFNAQNKYTGENAAVDSASNSQKVSVDLTETRAEGSSVDSEVLQAQPSSLLLPLLPAPLPSTAGSIFQPIAQPPPPRLQPVYSDTDIAEVVEDLVCDVLEGECREIGATGAAYVQSALGISDVTTEEIMTEVMLGILRQIASFIINAEKERLEEEKRRAEDERRRQEKEQLVKMLSESLGTTLTEEVVKEMMQEISAKELKGAVEKDQRARIARCSKEVCAEIMGVFLEDEIFQIAKETLQELQCFCKYLQRWREAVVARKKLKRQMRAFPAAPSCVDPNHKLKALSPSAECPIAREHLAKTIVNLGHAGNLGISCLRLRWLRNKTINQMKVQHFYQQLLWDALWTPLDLPSLVAENIPIQEEKVFWKAVLVLPSYEEYPVGDHSRMVADWLTAKFMIDKNLKENTSVVKSRIQTLALHTCLHTKRDRAVCVSVCIKVTHGTLSTSELSDTKTQKGLLGTSGLILLLSPRVRSEDVAEEDVYWLSPLLQLKRLLQAKPSQPIVPLVILVPSHGDEAIEKDVEEGLMLPDLISANLISRYNIVQIPDSVSELQSTNKLSEAVQWLVAQCPDLDKLHCQALMQYVEDGLDREFNKRFYQDMKERFVAGLPSQDPSAIIELYNSVVQFLAEVASSEDLGELSWPVAEFVEPGGSKVLPHLQWNTPSHQGWLKKALLSFQIPQMDLPPLSAPWRPVCAMIFQYLSQTSSSIQTLEILQSQAENLLSRTYFKWKSRKDASSNDDGPSVEEIPWDSILALCINHKLRDWKPPHIPINPEAVSKDGEIYVYFFEEHLRKFTCPVLWEQARLKTQQEGQQSQRRSEIKTQRVAKLYSYSMFPTEYCASQQIDNKELNISSGADLTVAVSEVEHLPECLYEKLEQEKTESRRFDEQLQQCLVKDSETFQDSVSLPLYLPETLVSVPHIIHSVAKTPVLRSPEAGSWTELSDTDTSLTHRLTYLKELIRANKEEEMTCELHLSTLLNMIDT